MTELKKVEINCETGEVIEIAYTEEEMVEVLAQRARDEIANAERRARIEAEQQAKIEAKASAVAKLAALGLTEAEAQAIAGN